MGDGPTKVEGKIGVEWLMFEEKNYAWKPELKGSYDDFAVCPELFLPCPKYIFPLPPLFCDKPPLKIHHFKIKTEKEMANERVLGFINDRAGKAVIPLSDADSIEVSKGKANDGEMKIRVVTKSARLFIVKANGTIYEEDLEENRVKVGEMSREDASALIASLYGKKELGRNPVPSDKHIESVTKDINGEDDIDIFNLMSDDLLDIPFYPFPQEKDKDRSEIPFNDPLSIPYKITW